MSLQKLSILVSALFAVSAIASPVALQKRVACTDGAVFFIVRGSSGNNATTPDGEWSQIPTHMVDVAQAIISKTGGGSYNAVEYPATNPWGPGGHHDYEISIAAGITALQNDVVNYAKSCSTGKIFIMGFSQGGEVVSGALGGTNPLKDNSRVTGVATYADPGWVPGVKPIESGTATSNSNHGSSYGSASIAQYQYLKTNYATRLRAFCQSGDAYCDAAYGVSAADSKTIHNNEPVTQQQPVTDWFMSLV